MRSRAKFKLLRETLIASSGVVEFIAGLVLAIGAIGFSLGPVLTGLGVLGIIVGLAVQDYQPAPARG